jgi:hypothetical protein
MGLRERSSDDFSISTQHFMRKADRDPREDGRASSDAARADRNVEASKVNAADAHGESTSPDDIPPVHVLEATQSRERREAEDLLAGFDRPGRTPRRHNSGDFVEHYGSSKPRNPPQPMPSADVHAFDPQLLVEAAGKAAHENKTVLVPRKRQTRTTLMWLAVGAAVVGLTGILAIVATSESGPASSPSSSTPSKPGPSVAATPSAASVSSGAPPSPTNDVPSQTPDPTSTATPTVISVPPPSAVPSSVRDRDRDRRGTSPSSSAARPGNPEGPTPATSGSVAKPPPRDDLIRTF